MVQRRASSSVTRLSQPASVSRATTPTRGLIPGEHHTPAFKEEATIIIKYTRFDERHARQFSLDGPYGSRRGNRYIPCATRGPSIACGAKNIQFRHVRSW